VTRVWLLLLLAETVKACPDGDRERPTAGLRLTGFCGNIRQRYAFGRILRKVDCKPSENLPMYYYPIVPFIGRASGATRHLKSPPAGFIGRGGFAFCHHQFTKRYSNASLHDPFASVLSESCLRSKGAAAGRV
jgi:hypothetical protein